MASPNSRTSPAFKVPGSQGDLNFKGGSISTLLFEKAALNRSSRINLNDTDFARFKAHWEEVADHVIWDPGSLSVSGQQLSRFGLVG